MRKILVFFFLVGAMTAAEFGPDSADICESCGTHLLCTFTENVETNTTTPTCSASIEQIVEGIGIHGISPRTQPFAPPWLNHTLYQIGQKFAVENIAIISYCHYLGAVLAFSIKEAGQILATSGNSHERVKAIKNNLAHIRHIWLWYENDILSPNNITYQSIHKIRSIHEEVSHNFTERLQKGLGLVDKDIYLNHTINEKLWEAFEKDLTDSQVPSEYRQFPPQLLNYKGNILPFPQYGMAIAQYLFAGLSVIMPEIQDILSSTEEEMLGWNHLWAVIGHDLGIDDKYNIALQPDLPSIMQMYTDLFNIYILPNFFHLEKESKVLMETLLMVSDETLPSGHFSFTPAILMHILLADVIGIPSPNTMSLLTSEEKGKWDRWAELKNSLRKTKEPLMSTLNADMKRSLDQKGRQYYGHVYTSDDSISKGMFLL